MSEYQIVMFRAIDRPLTDNQLAFMDRQSSRAEFSKLEFKVEYRYSSFRGDIDGMLRNGYDIFLNYTSYRYREIRIRLPSGLPFPKSVWSKYIGTEGLTWSADKRGKGGILRLVPCLEDSCDPIWAFDDYLDATAKIRQMLIDGDLRVLYLLWLCSAMLPRHDNGEEMEPPVPHGLGDLPSGVADILAYFETDRLLVDATAMGIPRYSDQRSRGDSVKAWLAGVSDSRRNEIIERLASEDPVDLKAELLSEIRDSQQTQSWPVEPPTRTVAQLIQLYESLREQVDAKEKKQAAAKAKREADKAEKQRRARMLEMQSDPDSWLAKASKLVESRGAENYREAARILADLRDAVGGEQGNKIAREHAAQLVKKYPTLNVLKSSLRKQQLWG